MLDVCLCGCGGTMPLKNRHLTSAILRLNGHSMLIDCGEGTQIAIKKSGFTFKPIDVICITHFHADHISGLPGLLLTMGNEGREEPLTIVGPAGIGRVVNSLRVIVPELPFEINFCELKAEQESLEIGLFNIRAYRLKHRIACYGYRLDVKRGGKFDVGRAESLGLPKNIWGRLQKGETVEFQGKNYYPSDVLGDERRGISVGYVTDTKVCDGALNCARRADLFICEGMFGEPDKRERADETFHMLMQDAAHIAADAEAGELWITHFSASLQAPDDYKDAVRAIFENSHMGYDGRCKTIKFLD